MLMAEILLIKSIHLASLTWGQKSFKLTHICHTDQQKSAWFESDSKCIKLDPDCIKIQAHLQHKVWVLQYTFTKIARSYNVSFSLFIYAIVHLTPNAPPKKLQFLRTSRKCLTLAVDRYGTRGALTDVQEASCEEITRCGAIYKKQVVMFKPGICEAPTFINLLVQSHNICDIVLAEVGEVRFWSVERITWKSQNSHQFTKTLIQ